MADKQVIFNCPCECCILLQVSKLEQKKLYNEADKVLCNGIQYLSSIVKTLENKRKNLKILSKENSKSNPTCDPSHIQISSSVLTSDELIRSSHSSQCQYTSHVNKKTKSKEFHCPVAIFDDVENPYQKAAYPKNLVYNNGADYQLEEIRAAIYWNKKQAKDQETLPANIRNIISSEHFNSWCSTMNTNFQSAPQKLLKKGDNETSKSAPSDVPVEKYSNLVDTKHVDAVPSNPIMKSNRDQEIENMNVLKSKLNGNTARSTPSDITNLVQLSSNMKSTLDPVISDHLAPPKPIDTATKSLTAVNSSKENVSPETSDPKSSSSQAETAPVPKILIQNSVENYASTRCSNDNVDNIKYTSSSSHVQNERLNVPRNIKECTTYKAVKENIQPNAVISTTFVVKSHNDEASKCEEASENSSTIKLKEKSTAIESLCDELVLLPDVDAKSWDDDNTCNTKAFAFVLPSSTPTKRGSQPFKPLQNSNGTCVINDKPQAEYSRMIVARVPCQNLSMIEEISRERYSSSSSVNTACEAAFKTQFIPIPVDDESSKLEQFVSDPFDLELIENLLKETKFPQAHHSTGYHQVNSNMPLMRTSSSVKLGDQKFSIVGKLGKGSYAKILKSQTVNNPPKTVALKQQKPSCPWEYYISKEIETRLQSKEKLKYFIRYSEIYVYRNGSILISEWAQYGSILALVNNLKKNTANYNRCPEPVTAYLAIQLFTAIEYLHSCKIIHGDVKPDNFVLFRNISPDNVCVKLIDYGRSIDMTLFPKNVVFTKVVTTEDFICNEMKENRGWTYQTDLFGLAGTIYLLLIGDYMKTYKRPDGTWTMKKSLYRYLNNDLWSGIFEKLLNVPSSSQLPNLKEMRKNIEAFYASVDSYTLVQQFNVVSSIIKK